MIRALSAGLLTAIVITAPAFGSVDSGYQTVQSLAVAGGSIQILEDARLTRSLASRMWKTAVDPVLVLGEDTPEAKTFETKPLRPARLRQIDRSGAVVLDIIPNEQAPIARLEERRLGPPSAPIYLITTDDSAGFGSYSGLATMLYAVQAGRLAPVRATGSDGRAEAVVLVDTLKSGWKIIDRYPAHTLIEQVLCRPDFRHEKTGQDLPFVLTYITYRSDARGWRMAKRTMPGFWENEGAWPALSNFPKVGAN
jgi:hypothetical protein